MKLFLTLLREPRAVALACMFVWIVASFICAACAALHWTAAANVAAGILALAFVVALLTCLFNKIEL